MRVEKVFFKSTDGVELFGLLHLPETNTTDVIISTHGISSNCMKNGDDELAKHLTARGIAYFSYNNRGFGIINYLKQENKEGSTEKKLGGAATEDILDSYYDIKGAVNKMINKGFQRIHLKGHSLGSTKTLYAYLKMVENNDKHQLEKISSIMLLSLLDIPDVFGMFSGNTGITKEQAIAMAEKMEKENRENEIMIYDPSATIISAKTFLRYFRDNQEINFACYSNKDFKYEKINSLNIPLFMRWGNVKELIPMDAEELAKMMNEKITLNKKDIAVLDGANHNYERKFGELAFQIYGFLLNTRQ